MVMSSLGESFVNRPIPFLLARRRRRPPRRARGCSRAGRIVVSHGCVTGATRQPLPVDVWAPSLCLWYEHTATADFSNKREPHGQAGNHQRTKI